MGISWTARLTRSGQFDVLPIIVLACAISGCVVALCAAAILVANPTEIRGVECNIVVSMQRLLKTGQIYTDPTAPPFFVEQYSPLQYYIIQGGCLLAGITDDRAESITRMGRMFSTTFHVASLLVMWLLMRRVLSVRRSIAIAAVGFYVGWIGVFPITVRPDALLSVPGFRNLGSCSHPLSSSQFRCLPCNVLVHTVQFSSKLRIIDSPLSFLPSPPAHDIRVFLQHSR